MAAEEENTLLKEIEGFVREHYASNVSDKYVFHSFDHTCKVVEAIQLIGQKSGLDNESLEIVTIGGWFHDAGISEGRKNHEDKSVALMRSFMKDKGLSDEKIKKIEGCIIATKLPQNPKTIEEQVLADADLFHLSSDTYFSDWELMKKEYELLNKEDIDQLGWLEDNVKFFKKHQYFTNYGKEVLQKRKDNNLSKIKDRVKWVKGKEKEIAKLEKELEKLKKKTENELKPDKGRETMLRITARNHLELSAMADNKANIMISINAIILSIVVTVLIRKLEESPYLILPTIFLTLVCSVTVVYAILATRPKVSKGMFSEEDVKSKKTNLLFFGNYHKMKLDEYVWGMQEMLRDPDYLYSSMIKDIYFVGVVLGRKYKLLRTAYTIFMFGFVLSIISFVLAYMSRTW